MLPMHGLAPADRSARRSLGIAVALLLAATLGAVSALPGPAAAAGSLHISLYVTSVGGWSDRPGGEKGNPGPAFAVVSGDNVTINLTSEDGLDHGMFIDYNDNGLADTGDYLSPKTSGTTTFSFVPNVPGTFKYCDQLVLLNCGTWSTQRANAAPTVAIEVPTATTSWTAGVAHDIVFNASDPDGDPVEVFLNYSYNAGSVQGSIAGPITAGSNPNHFTWNPSGFTAHDTVIHIVARDSSGLSNSTDSPPFEVDSTPPTILSTVPGSSATGVDRGTGIAVTWSDVMNPASGAPDAFAVRIQGGPWITGSVSWSADLTTMTFRPARALDAATTYEVHVNTSARDGSEPGNHLAAPDTWTFTTNSLTDSNRPTILGVYANPPQQFPSAPVNLSADVQDDVGVSGVTAAITGPSFNENTTMEHLAGTRWFVNRTFPAAGHYNVVVWASDLAGNLASQAIGFDISSNGNTGIPAPASVNVTSSDGVVEVRWTPVSFPGLAGYRVYRGDAVGGPFVRLTNAPLPPNAPTVYVDSPPSGRTHFYTVTAVNATGAESTYAPPSAVTIPPYRPSPILDPVPWAIAGLTLGLILGVLYGTVRRRKLA